MTPRIAPIDRAGALLEATARQLPEQSTIPWMDPSSIGDTRHRGALQKTRVELLRGAPSAPSFPALDTLSQLAGEAFLPITLEEQIIIDDKGFIPTLGGRE